MPFPGAWRSKFNAWIIDPPFLGSKHDTPILFGLVQMPKRGQALFIFYFIVINSVLSAVNYQYADPNTWYPDDKYRWMTMLISNRLGLLSFANLPLVFLYAGRNNILLWITNWSHSTFLLLHRWIAAIATLQAILHSIIYLYVYVKAGTHSSESKEPYWYWGIVGTLGLTLLFPLSVLPIRKKVYELFLAWHVAISILVVVGCYYHIVKEFSHQWGYETWIYICMAVWGFDRAFRILRLARHGVKRAEITVIDDEYVRITVPDVATSGHAYLYFPTLTWRVWENHPFSVASTVISTPNSPTQKTLTFDGDIEKQPKDSSFPIRDSSDSKSQSSDPWVSLKGHSQAGLTFYIRTMTGLTMRLRERSSVPVLLEAGYSSHSLVAEPLQNSPTLIALAGGVGITAVLPHVRAHPGRAKVYWGCRTQTLAEDLKSTGALSNVEKEIFVGKRMAIRDILENELGHSTKSEVCVLVSGPEGMNDEVRNVVGDIVKKRSGIKVRLEVESFNW
jgi:Ferric reductase like transmembrane component